LLRLQIEDGTLVVLFGRREVQRVPNTGIDRDSIREPPIILDEVLLKVRSVPNLFLLQINREQLDLPEEKAGERRARVGRRRCVRWQIGKQVAESELARWRWGLDNVEPLPAKVSANLERMSSPYPHE
jgi:hypothetical protein